MKKKLTKKELIKELKALSPEWKCNTACTSITKTLDHHSSIDALIFISKVVVHSEVRQLFPVMTLSQKKLKISFTIESGDGTTKDILNFAKLIDNLSLSTVIER